MPTLNKLTCTILLPPKDTPLPEYRRKYLDSSVSAYVPVPEIPILQAAPAFNIQLRSEDEWIAPGLAMFVYIDGYYQCNRSKRTPLTGSSALELRVRQKEEKLAGGGGGFVGREWRWVQLDVEQANGVAGSHKDLQDHMGKIEVVVLRCDAEKALAEEPRAVASAVKASAKAPSAKAPSAEVPSAKAPSAAKPAAAASEVGGMFGLFDGACDFGFDGAGDAMPGTFPVPEFDIEGRRWDPVRGLYRWPDSPSSTEPVYASPASSDYSDELHDLDGQGYNHPGVIVDRHGQPYAQRVPYYHTSTDRRPRRDNHGRSRNASVGYIQDGAMPPPPRPRGERAMGYAPDDVPVAVRSSQQHPRGPPMPDPIPAKIVVGPDGRRYVETWDQPQLQSQPTQGPRQYPEIVTGPDGQQYIDVSDQQQPQAYLPRTAAVPAGQRQTSAPLRGAARSGLTMDDQHAPQDHDGVPEGFTVAGNPANGVRYAVPANVAYKYGNHQLQQQHYRETSNQQDHNTDPEHQRSVIFDLGHGVTKLLGHDYRLVAAAVPHIPLLKKYDMGKITADKLSELQRQVNAIISRRHFPNGDRIMPMHDPRAEEQHETSDQQHQNTDIEHQRSIIFELRHGITKLLGYDYRLVAAAVPHIPLLKDYDIGKITPDKWDELKLQIKDVLSHRHFPDGKKIVPMHDASDDEAPDSKTPTKRRPDALASANGKVRQPHAAYDDTAQDREWIDKTAGGEYAAINQAWDEEKRKEEKERKRRHNERRDRKKHDDGSRYISDTSSPQYHVPSSNNNSVRDSQKDKIESQKGKKTESHAGGSGGWGSVVKKSKEATGDWDNPGDKMAQTMQPEDHHQAADPTPLTDGNNEKAASRAPFNQSHHSTRSSNITSHSISTSASKTINPHAAIQPYFDVLHPNKPENSKFKPNSHQTPVPRTPYVYPPTLAPHLSSSTLGNRSHGVRAGKGAEYTHATLRPKYLDTMESPYAVFVFEYRSVEKLGEILGRRGENLRGDMENVQEEVGMGVLMGMPKEKLVEELMRARGNGGGGGEEVAPPRQEKVTNGTADWAAQLPAWGAPQPAAAPAVKSTGKSATQHHHGHGHGHSYQSDHKSKGKADEDKSLSINSGWAVKPAVPTGVGGDGFVADTGANPGATW